MSGWMDLTEIGKGQQEQSVEGKKRLEDVNMRV